MIENFKYCDKHGISYQFMCQKCADEYYRAMLQYHNNNMLQYHNNNILNQQRPSYQDLLEESIFKLWFSQLEKWVNLKFEEAKNVDSKG